MDNSLLNELLERAKHGDICAQVELGARYATGSEEGIQKDLVTAIKWYELAAEGGSAEALYNLAIMRLQGEGFKPDEDNAIRMLYVAAENGSTDACLLLAEAYEDGNLNFDVNASKAATLYLGAAVFGATKGIHRLGQMLSSNKISSMELANLMINFDKYALSE